MKCRYQESLTETRHQVAQIQSLLSAARGLRQQTNPLVESLDVCVCVCVLLCVCVCSLNSLVYLH